MIKEWRVVLRADGSFPSGEIIGGPFYANHCYMSAFCVLEVQAYGRASEKGLGELETTGAWGNARAELKRRRKLER